RRIRRKRKIPRRTHRQSLAVITSVTETLRERQSTRADRDHERTLKTLMEMSTSRRNLRNWISEAVKILPRFLSTIRRKPKKHNRRQSLRARTVIIKTLTTINSTITTTITQVTTIIR